MNLPPLPEPDAHMWQHGETGNTGFLQDAPQEELDQWERVNRPRKIVAPMFSEAKLRQAQREAVAAYKTELFQKYEANTERATEAEGEAFTHGYMCGYGEAEQESRVCDVPPIGWRCTREKGHNGPCAAVECPEDVALVSRGMDRLAAASAPKA